MKTHLLDSCEPITEGRTQTAICGTEVKDAAFVFMWDETIFFDTVNEFVWISGMCTKCRKQWTTKQRYIYGITDGQHAKSGEREAAV